MSYNAPTLPPLVLTATFLALLPVTSHLSALLTNTDILGPLTLGILWCSPFLPSPAPLLPQSYSPFLSYLGYVGLLLLIFDAGISTPTSLLLKPCNLAASALVGLTGILFPIALSIALFHGAFGFPVLTAFAAGAALCSTSLGTTVSLLSGQMKKSRVGAVLMSAALLDDVVGLVIAGVIENLVPDGEEGGGIKWSTIVRPILVSVAYALGTPVLAVLTRRAMRSGKVRVGPGIRRKAGRLLKVTRTHVNLFIIICTLTAFVATTHLAGTSELFGAYLAGAFLGYVFEEDKGSKDGSGGDDGNASGEVNNPILATFNSHIAHTLLGPLLSPLFFASIGASIPVNQFFTIYLPGTQALDGSVEMVRSHRVVWRGIIYSLLMILAKAVTGVWVFLFWRGSQPREARKTSDSKGSIDTTKPDKEVVAAAVLEKDGYSSNPEFSPSPDPNAASPNPPSRPSTALLLGLAMVARGEIALIVAQLARPLLVISDSASGTDSEEPFVIVMWAVMLTTFGGALGVGRVIRATKDMDWSAS